MRLHIHDGSGHPIAVQLSRELARRGHTVIHTYATQWVSGHGRLTTGPDDPPTLRIEGITAKSEYDKYSPRRRIAWEVAYAKAFQRVLAREQWDVVILCNTQLITAAVMRRWLRRRRQPWVLWHQDIFAFAFADEAARKLPGPAAAARSGARRCVPSRNWSPSSSAVVAIGDPFIEQYREWGLPVRNVRMIPNWAPLEEIARLPRDEVGEAWAREHDIPPAQVRLLYAGMLGRKHNPQLLVDLLEQIRATGVDAQLVVASEGPGADYLAEQRPAGRGCTSSTSSRRRTSPRMLASGDVLVAVLEPEASRFSIPSKVLSYLAAGRPDPRDDAGREPVRDRRHSGRRPRRRADGQGRGARERPGSARRWSTQTAVTGSAHRRGRTHRASSTFLASPTNSRSFYDGSGFRSTDNSCEDLPRA